MKSRSFFSALLSFLLFTVTLYAGKRDALWKEVADAEEKSLPATAIEKLGPIIDGAMADKAWPEAIKAIARRIVFEAEIEGAEPEEKITRMEAEIAKAPKPMQPVMEAILAGWYWEYFQENRWKFMQRTQTAEAPGKDFTTWDIIRLFAEIDKHFAAALGNEAALKAVPIIDYADLLEKGTVSDALRPTLFDFVAHQALEFYSSGEQAANKAIDEFALSTESAVFGTVPEFLAWAPAGDAITAKAVRLYQALLRFHERDADNSAWLHCDLERLRFGNNQASGDGKEARYAAALKRFSEQWADREMSAMARYEWARLLTDDEPAEAHKIATLGAKAFQKSIGGRLCKSVVANIEAKRVEIETEHVWNAPWPVIKARYRNFTELNFRLVKLDFAAAIREANADDYEERLLRKKPLRSWKVALPATPDFRERIEQIAVPQDLKPSFYVLIASPASNFGEKDNVVSYTRVWVSDLALVMRERSGNRRVEGFVLNAQTGAPLEGAGVQLFQEEDNRFTNKSSVKSDANGLFSFVVPKEKNFRLLAEFGELQIASTERNVQQIPGLDLDEGERGPDAFSQTMFFTDRSIYRPGQTIQYKGICIRADRDANKYNVLGGQAVTIIFKDVNGKEIAKAAHKTNDYGSFSGSFTAPRDRLPGRMALRVDKGPFGNAVVNVEEYKRPKFQVVIEPPKEAATLDAKVSVEGKATAYTGSAIGGASVKYRVTRGVQLPSWWGSYFWWRQRPETNAQEIAHGTTTTKDDGSFAIEFTAKPDRAVSEKDEPVFDYTVSADITDTTGETRSAIRVVQVGYTALKAALSVDEWLTSSKPVELEVSTLTNDREPQAAEGQVKIYQLEQPDQVVRASLELRRSPWRADPIKEPEPDPAKPESWKLGKVAAERAFKTDAKGNAKLPFKLNAGPYRAMLETKERFGKRVTAQLQFNVLNVDGKPLAVRVPNIVEAPKWEVEPGEQFMALWATGYPNARAFIEIEYRGKMLQGFWTENGAAQQQVKQRITEAMRGGFVLHVTMVKENRAYLTSREVSIPWSNKELTVKWEHFTSKLEPAQKETWTVIVTAPDGKKVPAELVATLYDQSLDTFLPHQWQRSFNVFRNEQGMLSSTFENDSESLEHLRGQWTLPQHVPAIKYRRFPDELSRAGLSVPMASAAFDGVASGSSRRSRAKAEAEATIERITASSMTGGNRSGSLAINANAIDAMLFGGAGSSAAAPGIHSLVGAKTDPQFQLVSRGQPPTVDLAAVSARKNLNETAFFFPQLLARDDGSVAMEFTMPEALTTWRFMGFAHDRKLRSGLLEDKVVTAKDIMVQPNPPRFLREGDELEFTVKVSNQSATQQTGKVRLTLAEARTGKTVDADFANANIDREFDLPSHEARSFSWKLKVPDGSEPLSYRAVASTERLSDGEEGLLPVLSRRTLVTESLPLPIRGAQTKTFDFTRLIESGKSDTLKSQSLTVQMVSNPSWYAVMALPYLMEFPHECSEQTFNRLYANALAGHIAASSPKIRAVFDQWKGTPALDSPLEKNQDLKSVMLEETPWVQQAQKESSSRKNVGVLFDGNRLENETARVLRKLGEMQLADGRWPWFPGGRADDFITLYITTGFGRLRHLGVKIDTAPAVKSLDALDAWIEREYRAILKLGNKDENHLDSTTALYLYGRSFFIAEHPIPQEHKEAVDYFLGQARKYWTKTARQSQGHLAIALKRFGDKPAALGIVKSLKERAVNNEETGMFWRDAERSWMWSQAPIETHALMIEALDEVAADTKAVEDCKVWLLKQKQTQDWRTTKATADAIYALLLRGGNVLSSDALVEVSLGGEVVKPEKIEAGTGFYEQKFVRGEVKPEQGKIVLKKTDAGVAWGSAHWQYLEDMSKVTAYEGTPLKLTKALFTRQLTDKGPVLVPVKGKVKVGDELVVRLVLSTDRDMEYVHIKDHRGSGTEPVNVLSGYRWKDGLGFYETTRDAASHWYVDRLPKGNHVFEFTTRVVHRGRYQTGFATIECMYAPEFGAHSESIWIEAE